MFKQEDEENWLRKKNENVMDNCSLGLLDENGDFFKKTQRLDRL